MSKTTQAYHFPFKSIKTADCGINLITLFIFVMEINDSSVSNRFEFFCENSLQYSKFWHHVIPGKAVFFIL